MLPGIKLSDYITMLQTNGVRDAYQQLGQDLTCGKYICSHITNKDRYKDIKTSDSNIIPGLESKYFNGSYILDKKYIVTQYPLQNTISDFWNMIWTTNSNVIVNLTGDNSYLKYKSKYNVSVQLYYNDKILEVNKITVNGDKVVYYISFKKWIDHGVPSIEDFKKLMAIVTLYENLYKDNPLVVHCHAGVGRAGTFILIHYILNQFKEKNYWYPIEILKKMRERRAGMVQNIEQFNFAMEYICDELKLKSNKQPKKNNLNRSFDCRVEYFQQIDRNCLSNSTGHLHI